MGKFIQILSLVWIIMGGAAMAEQKTAIFAGGCFWCIEHDMKRIPGIVKAESGYSGGDVANPTYENYRASKKPHLEAVRVTYDTGQITYAGLVRAFWFLIDPFDEKGQFCDKGESYRAAIFYASEDERKAAEDSKKAMDTKFGKPTNLLILPAHIFYPAEEYHQNYADKNPIRYKYYRWNCGRDTQLEKTWGTVASR